LTPPVGIPISPAGTLPPPTTPPPSASSSAGASPARAHALLHEGNTSAALDLVLELLDADPLNVEARLIAGMAYQLAGDAQQATAALRAALVLDPDLWPAEMYLGFALRQLGDETSATRALRRGAELAATNERLPLSPSVATWFEGWRVDAIAMARHTKR
jgi:Flp pilus assembly protein TadD